MSTTRDQIESMKNELQQLRDEIRLKMHLASMDLRDRFEKIEPDVRDFEHRAEQVSEDVGQELHEGWDHLKKALTRIRDELRSSEG
jgi:predicted nuclease with TOPRIM domain